MNWQDIKDKSVLIQDDIDNIIELLKLKVDD